VVLDVIQLFQCEVACRTHQSAQLERAVTSTPPLGVLLAQTHLNAHMTRVHGTSSLQAGASDSSPASPLNSS
jgi:hypothetical protein